MLHRAQVSVGYPDMLWETCGLALRPPARPSTRATPLPSIGKINNFTDEETSSYLEAEVSSPPRTQKAPYIPRPEFTPLYQAAIFATTGALPLPVGLPLGHVGKRPPHRPRGLTALFVLHSQVMLINLAGCGVKKCRPALRAGSP